MGDDTTEGVVQGECYSWWFCARVIKKHDRLKRREIVVLIYGTFDNNLRMNNYFTKYLEEKRVGHSVLINNSSSNIFQL